MTLAKLNITDDLRNFEGINLESLFLKPEDIQIVGTVADKGTLYLIYLYDEKKY